MRYSHLFGKTVKAAPKDETGISAVLLQRAGFINKIQAGVYELLPLGLKVVEKISQIVREEMISIGGQEVSMTTLQPKEIWQETGRWEKLKGAMFQLKDSKDHDLGLGFTHEEPMIAMARDRISSYRDLPLYLFQIQEKYRDEPRPRNGLIRCREFLMKDLYSFHTTEQDLDSFYQTVAAAYNKIFDRIGLQVIYTEAGGGVFTTYNTHEFQVLAQGGEDTIFYCSSYTVDSKGKESCHFSVNREIAKVKAGDACPVCGGQIKEARAIEVGNIFRFGTEMSQKMNFYFTDYDGVKKPVFLGSYGIGITRTVATVVEVSHDEAGIIWPKSISPFAASLLLLSNDLKVKAAADKVYNKLKQAGIEVLYDDRQDVSVGEKFADFDLIGIPVRLVISEKTPKGQIEWRERTKKQIQTVPLEKVLQWLGRD